MPYSNPKQAKAIFLSIKRRQGEAAARAFARKHNLFGPPDADDKSHAKAKTRGYQPRKRSK